MVNVTTDASGNFSTIFQPLPTEAGQYTIGADNPGVSTDIDQDSFLIYGMRATVSQLTLRLSPGTPISGQFDLNNFSDLPLTGITASLIDAPAYLSATIGDPGTAFCQRNLQVTYSISASDSHHSTAARHCDLTTAKGASLDVPLNITVVPLTPQLVTNPGFLQRGMLRRNTNDRLI